MGWKRSVSPSARNAAAAKAARREAARNDELLPSATCLIPLFPEIITRFFFFQFSISVFFRLFLPTRLTGVLIAEDSSSARESLQAFSVNGGFIFPVNLPHLEEEEVRKVYR